MLRSSLVRIPRCIHSTSRIPSAALRTCSTMSLKLIAGAADTRTSMVKIAASLAGVSLDVHMKGEAGLRDPEVAGAHIQTLPMLVTRHGALPRTDAILRYVAALREDAGLLGEGPWQQAQVDQWLSVAMGDAAQAAEAFLEGSKAGGKDGASVCAEATRELVLLVSMLDAAVEASTFLVGERPTLADVALCCALSPVVGHGRAIEPQPAQARVPSFLRWYRTCRALPACAEHLGQDDSGPPLALAGPGPAVPAASGAGADAPAFAAAAPRAPSSTGYPGVPPEACASAGALEPSPELPAPRFNRGRLRVKEVLAGGKQLLGQSITVAGWVRTKRGQKNLAFVEVSDGSCAAVLQAVGSPDSYEAFQQKQGKEGAGSLERDLAEVRTGTCVRVQGRVVANPKPDKPVELELQDLRVVGGVPEKGYPLAKARMKLETLREHQHLRMRSRIGGAVARMRNALAFATHRFFQERGFYYVHTPLITASDAEGAGEMFRVSSLDADEPPRLPNGSVDFSKDFFGQQSHLTVSGQLQVESFACSMSDAYTFGPTFRAENSHTSKHLAEFWMIEPEIAFADLEADMDLAEDYLKFCTAYALKHCGDDLATFELACEKGLRARLQAVVDAPFKRITYTEAQELLCDKALQKKHKAKFREAPGWGKDLASEHEKFLTDSVFKCPVVVTDWPKSIKAFYMRANEDGKTVAAMDVLVPKIGEVIGGSAREERLDVLKARMAEAGVEEEHLGWYMDLRRFGSCPHAGFGLGFERLLMYVTGMENIRDVIPFPRYPGHAAF